MPENIFVKICGITNSNDALCACDHGASAIGFIKYKKSKRFINNTKLNYISNIIHDRYPDVLRVGVIVNAEIEEIKAVLNAGINVIQFHGDESGNFLNLFKTLTGNKISCWKAVKLKDNNNLNCFIDYNADIFLIDSFDPALYGGTGKTINWKLARSFVSKSPKPVILAGGITPDNVLEAVNTVSPYGIDLSSGVEKAPGIKSYKLIKDLFDKLK